MTHANDDTGPSGQKGAHVARVLVSGYTVSRIPDDSPDHSVWSIEVEAAGHGRWAVRNVGRCLTHEGTWEHEPQPSSRDDDFLARCRWDNVDEAINAALTAEPSLTWNGLTPGDVVSRQEARRG